VHVRNRGHQLLAFFAAASLGLGACDSHDRIAVNEWAVEHRPGEDVIVGGGCMTYIVGQRSGTSFGTATTGFEVDDSFDGRQLVTTVSSEGQVLSRRTFGLTFLRSGETSVLEVAPHADERYTIRLWGGSVCQSISPAELAGVLDAGN
jgi:hypothetical protein